MAKDRNTFAKRQREMDRKRKQDEKRQHKAKRKQDATNSSQPAIVQDDEQQAGVASQASSPAMSAAQRTVLTTFRQFRMTPGQMLCFSRSDEEAFRAPLSELAEGGFLVTERFQGGYSLTASGFAAMQAIS
jgi:hypothetical protein